MKFVCEHRELNNGLQIVQRAVSLKNPLPILSGIKFETYTDKVKLTATDLDIGISCTVPAQIMEIGSAVLPSRYITELIRRLPDLPIFIESDPQTGSAVIQYGQSEASINGYPTEEYPLFFMPDTDQGFSIPASSFKEIVRQVVFAADTTETRPIYSGVLFEIGGGELQVVATDTHRMAWRRFKLDNCEDIDINLIIPGKTLNELAKIISSYENDIKVTFTSNQVLFTTEGDISVISRLVDGQYPNYRMVIPREYVSRIRLKNRDLADATERASLLTREGVSVMKMNISEDLMIISVNTEAGRIREEVAVFHEGNPLQIAFNARYISDALKAVGSDDIVMEFTGPLSPGIIKKAGPQEDYLSLLLPLRLREE